MRPSRPSPEPVSLSRPSRIAVGLGLLLCLAVLASYYRQAATQVMEAQPRLAYREGYLLPSAATLKILGMGQQETMADLVWLRSLSYFASHFFLDRDYRWLDRYIETIIDLDPDFRMIYHWAGVVTMYGGQRIDNRAVANSIRFLEMGRQRHPDDWLINFMLGVNYRYELIPFSEAEARQWRLLGSTYLSRAAQQPEAPAWLALNASRNLEVFGAQEEATALDRQVFLNQRGALAATLATEMQVHALHPDYRMDPRLGLDILVGTGRRLQERLGSVSWARLLAYRRLCFADLDTDSGYLHPDLSVLVRGEPFFRIDRVRATPIDQVFYPTLASLMESHDRQ